MQYFQPGRLALAVTAALSSYSAVASEATPHAGAATQQDALVVTGRAQSMYRVEETDFATRTDTPIEKIPQSVQVIPQQLMKDQAARKITDLYQNIAGVNSFSYSGVTFRGFRQDEIVYDGVKGDPFNGFAVPQLFNIETVAVLKGPAAAIYGGGNPGGLINYITKKPQYETQRSVQISAGNDDFVSGAIELTGSVNNDETQAYRIGLYRDSESPFRDNTSADNTILDLGYRIDMNPATSLVLQYTDIQQELGGNRLRGVPVDDNGNFLADISWNHNETSDFQNLDASVWQGRLEHSFSERSKLDVTARYFSNDEQQNYHEPRGLQDTDGDGVVDFSQRQFRDQVREKTGISLTANLVNQFNAGGVGHTLLTGADWYRHDFSASYRTAQQSSRGGPVPGLSLVNPQYGQTSPANYDLASLTPRLTDTRSDRYGLYVQDQLDLTDNWSVTLGGRYDHFKDQNLLTGTGFSDGELTWRIGTTYNINDQFFPYALYGTGFQPQSASNQTTAQGGPFDPETSNIVELGLRTRLLDDSLALNLATYRIIRDGILQADPAGDVDGDGEDDLVQLGEVESQGFEVELVGDLTPDWVVTASYAYNDARVKQSSEQTRNSVPGTDRFANAPRNTFGLWSRYQLPSIDSSISMGVDYVDEQFSLSGQRVKSYTIYNLSWATDIDDWQLQMNIKNLFDEEYASSGFLSRSGHFPGEPRRVYLSATYNF